MPEMESEIMELTEEEAERLLALEDEEFWAQWGERAR
jgi:hypothetical protein